MTLGHAGMLEQVHGILSLEEEEAVGGPRDRDPEEVMELSEICHGKLRVKKSDDVLK